MLSEEMKLLLRDLADDHGPTAMLELAYELEKICVEKSLGLAKAKAKDPTSAETDALQRWANLGSRFSFGVRQR